MDVIGIGTDITECLRIARMIERHGDLFINRVYTNEEIRYCQNRKQGHAALHGTLGGQGSDLEGPGNGLDPRNHVAGHRDSERARREADRLRSRRNQGRGRPAWRGQAPGVHLSLPHPRHRLRDRSWEGECGVRSRAASHNWGVALVETNSIDVATTGPFTGPSPPEAAAGTRGGARGRLGRPAVNDGPNAACGVGTTINGR